VDCTANEAVGESRSERGRWPIAAGAAKDEVNGHIVAGVGRG
jgi:hypothetical protein